MSNKIIDSRLSYMAKLIAGIILVIYVLRKNNIHWTELYSQESLIPMAVLLFLQIIIFILASYRWVLIYRCMSGQHLSLRQGSIIMWIGQFYTSFLPELISTDVARFYYINKIYPGIKNNIHSIVKDRVVSLISLCLLALFCFLAYIYNISFSIYLISVFLFFVFLLIITSKLTHKFQIPKAAFFLSFITFHLKALSLVYIVLFFYHRQNYSAPFYLSMIGQLFELIPLTPANIGIGHFAFDLIFKLETGIIGAIVYNYYFTSKFIFKLAGGLPWLFYRGKKVI